MNVSREGECKRREKEKEEKEKKKEEDEIYNQFNSKQTQ